MTTVWVALLRAVYLGVRNKVPMAAPRDHLAAAGLPGARTHRPSGNVLNAAMVARRLGLHGTERNWATITELRELMDQEP